MTIKSSGAVSLVEISAEYNGTGSHSLSEYYTAPGLPSSGAISFSDFYNKSDSSLSSRTTSRSTSYTTYFGTSVSTEIGGKGADRTTARTTDRITSRITFFVTEVVTRWSADNPT